ncbi:hypothetical protein JVU11DRAFT_5464 [Chiua virens]|nr:hypothetical protein JVU11DRAFT_5464 [Chiua virens]
MELEDNLLNIRRTYLYSCHHSVGFYTRENVAEITDNGPQETLSHPRLAKGIRRNSTIRLESLGQRPLINILLAAPIPWIHRSVRVRNEDLARIPFTYGLLIPRLERPTTEDIAWLLDEDEDPDMQILSSSPACPKMMCSTPRSRRLAESIDQEVKPVRLMKSPLRNKSPSTPCRFTRPSHVHTPEIPEGSFAVRPAGRRRIAPTETSETPAVRTPLRRLRRNDTEIVSRTSTPPLQPKRQPPLSIRHNPWLDGEAAHSGDEESAGSSHSEEDVESESDRQFLKDIPDTQVSPSYDQTLAYRRSLLTQAPGEVDGPVFASKPVRRGEFVAAREHSRRRLMVSSSPPREDFEPDEYAIGSFVVADDADWVDQSLDG